MAKVVAEATAAPAASAGQVRIGQVRIVQVQIGQVRADRAPTGQVRADRAPTGQVQVSQWPERPQKVAPRAAAVVEASSPTDNYHGHTTYVTPQPSRTSIYPVVPESGTTG